MEKRVALIGIVVEDIESVEALNHILIPYRCRGISIISIAVDAPMNVISTISGKLGMLKGLSVKTIYSKAGQTE